MRSRGLPIVLAMGVLAQTWGPAIVLSATASRTRATDVRFDGEC